MTLLVAGGVTVLVVVSLALIVRALLHKEQALGWQEILAIYFYLVSIVSLLAVVSGGASMTKAFLSSAFGRDFSYQSSMMSSPEPAGAGALNLDPKLLQQQKDAQNAAAKQEKERIEQAYQDDLFTGASTLIVGLLFLGVHMFGWWKLQERAERSESFWYRGYILLQLILYGLVTLVALPLAISQTLRFFVMANGANMPQPGEVVGVALWAAPVWIVFIWLALRMSKVEKVSTEP